MKEGYVMKFGANSQEDMEKINRYTRREYGPEEVYTFSLVLCDNEVDRDFERFSVSALEQLQKLFLGKTCILDHERKSVNQTARIYDTALEKAEGRVTQAGEPYVRLTAKAYLPKTEKNRETVELIESGILKEVSVSCSVKRSVCGICGKESCSHQKGREYGGKVCCRVLEEPTDAYECSFVAVPAQREAGVRKGWRDDIGEDTGKFGPDSALLKKLEDSAGRGVSFTSGEAGALLNKMRDLEEKAALGESYVDSLRGSILRYSGLFQPEIPREVVKAAVECLPLRELSLLGEAYEEMARKAAPLRPQLAPEREETGAAPESNREYRI